jgi:hypothetical protein
MRARLGHPQRLCASKQAWFSAALLAWLAAGALGCSAGGGKGNTVPPIVVK